MYSLNSDVLSRTELNEYAETFIAQRLSTITGVAQVQVYGSGRAVRVQLDPERLPSAASVSTKSSRPSTPATPTRRPAC